MIHSDFLLKRFINLSFVSLMLIIAVLACTGSLNNMLVNGEPFFQRPTDIPIFQPTAIPGLPTIVPLPTVTPFVIRPPQAFYIDDTVDAGNVQFRLSHIAIISSSQPIATWQLDVTNRRSTPYEFFLAGQMVVTRLMDGQTGEWGASAAAARKAGINFRYETYSLNPGDQQTMQLAAYLPASAPAQFIYRLNPTDFSEMNSITWLNQPNPYC